MKKPLQIRSFRTSPQAAAPQGGFSCPLGAIHLLGIPILLGENNP